jgi:hypothetical protein
LTESLGFQFHEHSVKLPKLQETRRTKSRYGSLKSTLCSCVSMSLPSAFLLKLCQSVPVDTPKDLKTSLQQKQEQRLLAIYKRIELLGGELPMNWLDCELIYLERFAQKLQRNLDRQVIGLCPPQRMHMKRAYARLGAATLLAVKSVLLKATYPSVIHSQGGTR